MAKVLRQNVKSALALADRAYVLRQGTIVMAGPTSTLLADEAGLRQHLVS